MKEYGKEQGGKKEETRCERKEENKKKYLAYQMFVSSEKSKETSYKTRTSTPYKRKKKTSCKVNESISHDEKKDMSHTEESEKKMSTLGVIISVLSGFFLQAIIYDIFDIYAGNVPGIVVVILWAMFTYMTALIVEAIGL